nr:hypothetical protein [Paracoccus sp. MC1862]
MEKRVEEPFDVQGRHNAVGAMGDLIEQRLCMMDIGSISFAVRKHAPIKVGFL